MVVIRGTKKLQEWFPPSAPIDEPSTTRLGDWYGHMFYIGRIRAALFVSERSRLPVLIPSSDLARVAPPLRAGLKQVLQALNISADLILHELTAMTDVRFAPINSRSLLGAINDYGRLLEWRLSRRPTMNLLELALELSETPIGPLRYQIPAVLTTEVFKPEQSPPQ